MHKIMYKTINIHFRGEGKIMENVMERKENTQKGGHFINHILDHLGIYQCPKCGQSNDSVNGYGILTDIKRHISYGSDYTVNHHTCLNCGHEWETRI